MNILLILRIKYLHNWLENEFFVDVFVRYPIFKVKIHSFVQLHQCIILKVDQAPRKYRTENMVQRWGFLTVRFFIVTYKESYQKVFYGRNFYELNNISSFHLRKTFNKVSYEDAIRLNILINKTKLD